jgi:hypothetical protein
MANDPDEGLLARNMIDVHGAEAATIARGNARDAALARQPVQARSWIRVLGIIQRQRAAQPVAGAIGPRPADCPTG